jgi:hypothetical protein
LFISHYLWFYESGLLSCFLYLNSDMFFRRFCFVCTQDPVVCFLFSCHHTILSHLCWYVVQEFDTIKWVQFGEVLVSSLVTIFNILSTCGKSKCLCQVSSYYIISHCPKTTDIRQAAVQLGRCMCEQISGTLLFRVLQIHLSIAYTIYLHWLILLRVSILMMILLSSLWFLTWYIACRTLCQSFNKVLLPANF